ncbi:protein of unknown function [Acidithiobacillus ferrivorans]|uniref:Uncharacterized protein n=1 Tax=Acidithiobacillus ferrivorans TaxID=160808 RepID=A0ABY1MSK3_9PROT|nr:protein of unknown function [Acidithiobacillus ferrivorans]
MATAHLTVSIQHYSSSGVRVKFLVCNIIIFFWSMKNSNLLIIKILQVYNYFLSIHHPEQ